MDILHFGNKKKSLGTKYGGEVLLWNFEPGIHVQLQMNVQVHSRDRKSIHPLHTNLVSHNTPISQTLEDLHVEITIDSLFVLQRKICDKNPNKRQKENN